MSKSMNSIISHCKKGQGGRTVSKLAKRAKGQRASSSESRGLRVKNQFKPLGQRRWKFGYKYTPIHVKLNPDGSPIDWTPTKMYS